MKLSFDLVNFILQKEAIFQPVLQSKRLPLSNTEAGYASSIWPSK